jgi:hypothetical protein
MPTGCSFHPRCPYATEICARQAPPLFEISNGHLAACFHRDQVSRRQDLWEEAAATTSEIELETAAASGVLSGEV